MTDVLAPTSGIVNALHLADDDPVITDEVIMEIEVMKMLVPVESPCVGIVHYHCQPGQFVQEGDVIATVVP